MYSSRYIQEVVAASVPGCITAQQPAPEVGGSVPLPRSSPRHSNACKVVIGNKSRRSTRPGAWSWRSRHGARACSSELFVHFAWRCSTTTTRWTVRPPWLSTAAWRLFDGFCFRGGGGAALYEPSAGKGGGYLFLGALHVLEPKQGRASPALCRRAADVVLHWHVRAACRQAGTRRQGAAGGFAGFRVWVGCRLLPQAN